MIRAATSVLGRRRRLPYNLPFASRTYTPWQGITSDGAASSRLGPSFDIRGGPSRWAAPAVSSSSVARFLSDGPGREGAFTLPPKGDLDVENNTDASDFREMSSSDPHTQPMGTGDQSGVEAKKSIAGGFLSPNGMSSNDLHGSPTDILHDQYKRFRVHGGNLAEYYNLTSMAIGDKTMYHHATFTCPRSGSIFPCGTPLASEGFPHGELREGKIDYNARIALTVPSAESIDTPTIQIFYSSERAAKNAAAARAIDCLSLAEFRDQNGMEAAEEGKDVFRLCAEDPNDHLISVSGPIQGRQQGFHFLSPGAIRLIGSPKELLFNNMAKFSENFDKADRRRRLVHAFETFSINDIDDEGRKLFTATYEFPPTGEIFGSGTVQDSQVIATINGIGNPKRIDGRIYYRSMKAAEHAAAARAIDVLSLREFQKRNFDDAVPVNGVDVFKLCSEEPLTALKPFQETLDSSKERFLSPVSWNGQAKSLLMKSMQTFHPDLFYFGAGGRLRYMFVTSSVTLDNDIWYTSTFNCPLTERIFESGTVQDQLMKDAFPGYLDVASIEGKVYYKHWNSAEGAAAARAIDSLSLKALEKENGVDADIAGENPAAFRLCAEDPVTSFDYTTYEERLQDFPEEFEYFMSAKGSAGKTARTLKECLYLNYKTHATANIQDTILFFNSLPSHPYPIGNKDRLWTSTFTCPLSGEVFEAGTLISSPRERGQIIDGKIQRYERYENEYPGCRGIEHIDGKVYYYSKSDAKDAAAARAIDSLSLREFLKQRGEGMALDDSLIFRFCEEEPYLSESERPQYVQGASLAAAAIKPRHIVLPLDIAAYLHMEPPRAEEESSYPGVDDPRPAEADNVGDEEDNYVLHHIQGSAHAESESSSALERLIEAWVDPVGPNEERRDRHDHISPHAKGSALRVLSGATQVESISNALAWFHRLEHGISWATKEKVGKKGKFSRKKTVGAILQTPVSVEACNTILRALGRANLGDEVAVTDTFLALGVLPSRQEGKVGLIEILAQQILERMDSQRASAKGELDVVHLRKPNTDTFNAYIGCIRRQSPDNTAAAAQEVLNKMCDRKEEVYPSPDIETFNSVIDLWASVPGNDARQKVEDLYQNLIISSLKPNRRTFTAALASFANRYSNPSDGAQEAHVALDKARQWIDRMDKIANSNDDESLRPDTEIYNAPLPWSGRHSKGLSPWDDYEDIYHLGFHESSTKDAAIRNAENMETWVTDMVDRSRNDPQIAPNVETYESLIQAWTRTGTYEGVLRAEEWAGKLIKLASATNSSDAHSLRPRLQTFHPIIAAWAHSGYPERLQQWVDMLDELQSNMPEMKTDGRMKSAHILAWSKRQALFSDQDSSGQKSLSPQARVDAAFHAAREAMRHLEDIHAQTQHQFQTESDPSIFLDAPSVMRAIDLWSDAAELSLRYGEVSNDASAHIAVSEMVRAAELVGSVIDMYRSDLGGIDEVKDLENALRYRNHSSHLKSASSFLYARAIDRMNTIDKSLAVVVDDPFHSHFSRFLPAVERMLRRSEDYALELIGDTHERELVYNDLFSFDGRATQASIGLSSQSSLPLYYSVAKGCELLAGTKQYGDAIRLVELINKSKASPELESQVLSLFAKLPIEEEEKLALANAFRTKEKRKMDPNVDLNPRSKPTGLGSAKAERVKTKRTRRISKGKKSGRSKRRRSTK